MFVIKIFKLIFDVFSFKLQGLCFNSLDILFYLIMIVFIALLVYFILSNVPTNFCKLLLYLSLTIGPRFYLLSFFLIPLGQTPDVIKIQLAFLFTILVIILHYFARFLVDAGVIKDYEQVVSGLLVAHSYFSRFLVIFYLLFVLVGFFFAPKMSHYFILFLLAFLSINQVSPLKVIDKLVLIFFHPRAFIFLMFFLQLNIFFYIFTGSFLLFFFCGVPLDQMPSPVFIDDMTPIVSMTILTGLSKLVGPYCDSLLPLVKSTEGFLKDVPSMVLSKDYVKMYDRVAVGYVYRNLSASPYYPVYCARTPILDLAFSSSKMLTTPFDNIVFNENLVSNKFSVEQLQLIADKPVQFSKELLNNLENKVGSELVKLSKHWIEKKVALDAIGGLGAVADKRVVWNFPVNVDEVGAQSMILVDVNQLYHSTNPSINNNSALSNIMKHISLDGLSDTLREFNLLNAWLAKTEGDKFFVIRGPLGDFLVISQHGSKYVFNIVECKESANLTSNLGQVQRSLLHSVRLKEYFAIIVKLNAELPVEVESLEQQFTVLAARGDFTPQTLDEAQEFWKVSQSVRNSLGANLRMVSLQSGSQGNLSIESR